MGNALMVVSMINDLMIAMQTAQAMVNSALVTGEDISDEDVALIAMSLRRNRANTERLIAEKSRVRP